MAPLWWAVSVYMVSPEARRDEILDWDLGGAVEERVLTAKTAHAGGSRIGSTMLNDIFELWGGLAGLHRPRLAKTSALAVFIG
jgi:hypothetical protein